MCAKLVHPEIRLQRIGHIAFHGVAEPSRYDFRGGAFLCRQKVSQRFPVSAVKSRLNPWISPFEFGDVKISDSCEPAICHFAILKMTALLPCGLLFQA